jgi:hypothetical protein
LVIDYGLYALGEVFESRFDLLLALITHGSGSRLPVCRKFIVEKLVGRDTESTRDSFYIYERGTPATSLDLSDVAGVGIT